MFTSMIASVVFALASSSLVRGRAIPVRRSLEIKRSVTVTDFSGGTGDGTYYDAGLGACGIQNSNSDLTAAIGTDFFLQYAIHMGVTSGNPNENPICNKKVIATYQGKSVTVAITDECEGCTNPYSLDFTPTAFSQLADLSVGRITGVTWVWADSDSSGSDSSSQTSSSSSSNVTDASPTDSTSGWTSSVAPSATTDTDSAAETTSANTWTSATNTWTSVPTGTSASFTSSITPIAVVNVGSLSETTTSSGFITRTSSSALPSGTALGGSNTSTTQASKQSSGARRSIRRIWEL